MREKRNLSIDEINVILPERLKHFREQKGYSLRDVATLIKKSPSQVSFWERGLNPPNCMDLFKLCLIYNISLGDLFPEINQNHKLKREELELIKKYRNADNDVKTTIQKILKFTQK